MTLSKCCDYQSVITQGENETLTEKCQNCGYVFSTHTINIPTPPTSTAPSIVETPAGSWICENCGTYVASMTNPDCKCVTNLTPPTSTEEPLIDEGPSDLCKNCGFGKWRHQGISHSCHNYQPVDLPTNTVEEVVHAVWNSAYEFARNLPSLSKSMTTDEAVQTIQRLMQEAEQRGERRGELRGRIDEVWKTYTKHDPNTTHSDFLVYLKDRTIELQAQLQETK